MAREFEGDLTGAEFWGADLRHARFRDVDLTGVRISHARVVDVEVDALVDRLVVNGVDVTAHVAEHDPWRAVRPALAASTPDELRDAWAALTSAWRDLLHRALALPDEALRRSVDGEWSLVQTLRHLVFATDKWCSTPVLGLGFDPIGLPNTGSTDFPWPDLDRSAEPSTADVLAVRVERASLVDEFLSSVTEPDLARSVDVLENGTHTVRECLQVVLEEEFWHLRYAARDLEVLEVSG